MSITQQVERSLCPGCGREFISKYRQMYCTSVCKHKHQGPMDAIKCPTCSVKFIPKNKLQLYCSRKCSPSMYKKVERTDTRQCVKCGSEFIPKRRETASRPALFCSDICRSAHHRGQSQAVVSKLELAASEMIEATFQLTPFLTKAGHSKEMTRFMLAVDMLKASL